MGNVAGGEVGFGFGFKQRHYMSENKDWRLGGFKGLRLDC